MIISWWESNLLWKGEKNEGVKLERVMGIEPTSKAWEALVLPLNYTRENDCFTTTFR